MFGLFALCSNFNQPLNSWNTSNVDSMAYMFNTCTAFNKPLNNWVTSTVTDMSNMFYNCLNFNQPLNNWVTSIVTNMSNMFYNCTAFNQDISGWNLSKIAGTQFYTLAGRLVFTFTSTSNAIAYFIDTHIPLFFNTYFTKLSSTISPDLSSGKVIIDTTYTVTCVTSYNSNTANTSYNFGLSFYISDAVTTKTTFYNNNTTNLSITTLQNIPLTRTGGNQFAYLTNISTNFFAPNTVVPLILPNTSLFRCFRGCNNFNSDISGWNTINVTDMSYMFYNCTNFTQSLNIWNTTKVTDMSYMFYGCINQLKQFYTDAGYCLWLDASDTSTITTISGKVSQWKDKTPKNYHMLQDITVNQPTYNTVNGISTLSFTASTSTYLYGNAAANNFEIGYNSYALFIVCKFPSNVTGTVYAKSIYGGSPGRIAVYRDNAGLGILHTKSDINNGLGQISNTYSDNTYRILELIVNRVQGIDTSYQNGSFLKEYLYSPDTTTNYTNTYTMLIGAYNNGSGTNPHQPSFYLNGNVAEVVSFSNSYDMTPETRQKIEGNLACKWGLQANLPLEHPYRYAVPY